VALVDGPAGVSVRHGGYAVAGRRPPDQASTGGARPTALTRSDSLTSAIIGLSGYDRAAVHRDVDANAFGPCSATPYLLVDEHPGEPLVLVCAVVLSGDTVWPEAIADSIGVEVDGHRVALEFADGTHALVRVG
jgi:hypothetical protein